MTTARWQAVWITLSDGTIAKFVGPAVVEEGDTRTITKIQFTAPAEMPAGCGFEEIPQRVLQFPAQSYKPCDRPGGKTASKKYEKKFDNGSEKNYKGGKGGLIPVDTLSSVKGKSVGRKGAGGGIYGY